MLNRIIFDNKIYNVSNDSLVAKDKDLDTIKLKKLLYNLGFKLTSVGTYFIIEELTFFFNNNLSGFSYLKDAYSISAQIHDIKLKNVQWAVESAITAMLRFSNVELLKTVFFWYTNNEVITPREFMSSMILYLEDNEKKYNKNAN